MSDKDFEKCYSYGTELKERSQGADPVPFQKMAQINLLLTTCRSLAITDQQKSIVNRTQEFWDVCFRKWHYNSTEPEEDPQPEKEEIMKELPPGPFERAKMIHRLLEAAHTLQSGRMSSMTLDRFHGIFRLIEQCESFATTKSEKIIIAKAHRIYNRQFDKWTEQQNKKGPEPKLKIPSGDDFDSKLSENDKKFLIALRIIKEEK